MKEQAIAFGLGKSLLGVLTVPDHLDPSLPAVVIPNTGLDHRVGPHRMHVELARGLARAGYPALRFDVSGLGDSELAAGQAAVDSVRDLRAALDMLEARGLGTRFVAFGLCSGANDAHQAALVDRRIVAAIFLDGYTYKTRRFWVNYWFERFTSSHRYRNALLKLRKSVMKRAREQDADWMRDGGEEYFLQPSQVQMTRDLETFIYREMPMYFIYTGDVQFEYNYRDQLLDAFPILRSYPLLGLDLMLNADHTFSRGTMRTALIERVIGWLGKSIKPPRG